MEEDEEEVRAGVGGCSEAGTRPATHIRKRIDTGRGMGIGIRIRKHIRIHLYRRRQAALREQTHTHVLAYAYSHTRVQCVCMVTPMPEGVQEGVCMHVWTYAGRRVYGCM